MKILTAITGTPSTAVFTSPTQQVTIVDQSNPRYPRNIVLSNSGVKVVHGTTQAGITLAELVAAMVTLEPTLTYPPLISISPPGQPVSFNTVLSTIPMPADFSIIASSEIAFTYLWQYSTNGGTTWNNATGGVFSGYTSPVLALSDVRTLGNSYLFRCVLTNASGVTISNTVSLIVDPDITTEPADSTVTAPAAASFAVTVGYHATTISYLWQVSTDGGISWTNASGGVYSGGTTATLAISNSTGLNGHQYRCILSDNNGASLTRDALLTVM